MEQKCNCGVYIGRFQPLHLGHEYVISEMIKNHGIDNSLIMIGTPDNRINPNKNIFSFGERYKMIKNSFPEFNNIIALADVFNNKDWALQIKTILTLWKPKNEESNFIFYYGSDNDIKSFYTGYNFTLKNMNRENFAFSNISGTLIRDELTIGNKIDNYINKNNLNFIYSIWDEKCKKDSH